MSNHGDMTSFRYGDYKGLGLTEEYIDLQPILENLYINPNNFLKPIKSVKKMIIMNTTERDTIAAKADMIVCGYAFLRTEDAFIHVVHSLL